MDNKPKYLIVVAGGSGTRMGSATPKQFLPLDGRPILLRTLERFVEAVPGIRLITVLPKDHIAYWKELCIRFSFTSPQRLVAGIGHLDEDVSHVETAGKGGRRLFENKRRPVAGPLFPVRSADSANLSF